MTSAIVDLLRNSTGSNFEIDGEEFTRFNFFKMTLMDHLDLECLYVPVCDIPINLSRHIRKDSSGREWIIVLS